MQEKKSDMEARSIFALGIVIDRYGNDMAEALGREPTPEEMSEFVMDFCEDREVVKWIKDTCDLEGLPNKMKEWGIYG